MISILQDSKRADLHASDRTSPTSCETEDTSSQRRQEAGSTCTSTGRSTSSGSQNTVRCAAAEFWLSVTDGRVNATPRQHGQRQPHNLVWHSDLCSGIREIKLVGNWRNIWLMSTALLAACHYSCRIQQQQSQWQQCMGISLFMGSLNQ